MGSIISAAFTRPSAIVFTLLIIFGIGINSLINIPKELFLFKSQNNYGLYKLIFKHTLIPNGKRQGR